MINRIEKVVYTGKTHTTGGRDLPADAAVNAEIDLGGNIDVEINVV